MIRISFLTKELIAIIILLYRKHSNEKITTGSHQHCHHLSNCRVRRVVQTIKMMQLPKVNSRSEKDCVEMQALVSWYQMLS